MVNKSPRSLDYVLETRFLEKIGTLEEAVTDGSATDFATYQNLCGQIRGIRFAVDCLKEMRNRLGLDEDQDLK